jgi:hypothetical protein
MNCGLKMTFDYQRNFELKIQLLNGQQIMIYEVSRFSPRIFWVTHGFSTRQRTVIETMDLNIVRSVKSEV